MASQLGLQVNAGKTEYLMMSRNRRDGIDDEALRVGVPSDRVTECQSVANFKYLGSQ